MAETNKHDKLEINHIEDLTSAGLMKVYERHGRTDLIPLPSDLPEDPLNWSSFRKNSLLILVALHTGLGPFSAAAAIPSFEIFVDQFGVSLTEASYFTAVPILFLGTFPFLWAPVSSRIGRRPVYLASMLLSAAMQLASAYCTTYGTLMTCRILTAIFICPPQSIGASTVSEVFFVHEKAQKMGIWALLVSVGPSSAALVMGPLVYHTGKWQWTFWLLAIMNLVHFVLYLFLCPETLFDRPERKLGSEAASEAGSYKSAEKWYTSYITFKRHSKRPWSKLPLDIVAPLRYLSRPTIVLPSIANGIVFTYTNVLLTVQVPALLGKKYELNIQQVGLQFSATLIGLLLGEPIAGFGSDRWMQYRVRKANGQREAEWRLPFSIPGFLIAIIGLMIFGVQLQNTRAGVWNVTPLVGSALSVFGQQIVATVCVTYAIESQPRHTPQAAILVSLIRQLFAFSGPFYFTAEFEALGTMSAVGLLSGIIAFTMCLTIACMVFGKSWRAREESLEDI
ncbi:MFS multidrug transporter [Rhodocollybia butyracea]|uniref:MFS multidrug transporter n=1 Tax=Rhodocollybia butyracea TaxID=206335 RepID=A0A9P5PP55_9AGAR|nr:MFS multidrug transporter [Rhodocollybia butyracea]